MQQNSVGSDQLVLKVKSFYFYIYVLEKTFSIMFRTINVVQKCQTQLPSILDEALEIMSASTYLTCMHVQ